MGLGALKHRRSKVGKIGGMARGKLLSVARSTSCVNGKNPRKAIAAALRKAAGQVSKRSGAFAGF